MSGPGRHTGCEAQGLSALGLKPAKTIRGEPVYKNSEVLASIKRSILGGTYFSAQVKQVMNDTNKAVELIGTVEDRFVTAINKFFETENRMMEQTRKTTGAMKDAAERLAQGLGRVEKAANLERLERYVGLLERAAKAMNALADLERDGKLEKIASAIR